MDGDSGNCWCKRPAQYLSFARRSCCAMHFWRIPMLGPTFSLGMNESTNRFATLVSSNIFAHPKKLIAVFWKPKDLLTNLGDPICRKLGGVFFCDADPWNRIPTFSQRVYGRTFGSDAVVSVYFFDSLQLNTKLKESRWTPGSCITNICTNMYINHEISVLMTRKSLIPKKHLWWYHIYLLSTVDN